MRKLHKLEQLIFKKQTKILIHRWKISNFDINLKTWYDTCVLRKYLSTAHSRHSICVSLFFAPKGDRAE